MVLAEFLKFLFRKERESLWNRINDLERGYNILIGTNTVLEKELADAKAREQEFKEKLFNVTGINRVSIPIPTTQQQPINIGGGKQSWAQARIEMERKAFTEAWEKKSRESKKNDLPQSSQTIEELEQTILEEKENVG